MDLPEEYILQQFYIYAGYPLHKKSSNTYTAGCPSCREGTSWQKKRRLFYIPSDKYIYCHNCLRKWTPINWVIDVSGKTFGEVCREVRASDYRRDVLAEMEESSGINNTTKREFSSATLPEDSINLFDSIQCEFYKGNRTINEAFKLIKDRRLDTAVNKPKTLWLSLTDYVHKNRLCIPFYDEDNQIRFYQTRAIYKEDAGFAKYLSKIDADKTLFGVQNIDPELDHLFMFEGPIDAMFMQNGLGVCGIAYTEHQQEILNRYRVYERIWVLDNQPENDEVQKKLRDIVNKGERVFVWPTSLKAFKDFNEVACNYGLNEISPKFVIENSFSGYEALARLNG